jgi:hypothetical protein
MGMEAKKRMACCMQIILYLQLRTSSCCSCMRMEDTIEKRRRIGDVCGRGA